jgi:HTH-type transcriptional regulator/antitoxin HigA
MTVGAKDAGKFWLNLLHELGHIACGHLSTSQGTTEEQEREADEFARGWLMSPDDNE